MDFNPWFHPILALYGGYHNNYHFRWFPAKICIFQLIWIDFNRFLCISVFFWRFSIGCGSKLRAKVAYLKVGSSDLEPIHEQKLFLMTFKCFFSVFFSFFWLMCGFNRNPGGKWAYKIQKVYFWLKMTFFDEKLHFLLKRD